jgi:release factor glutamine methyltransferase
MPTISSALNVADRTVSYRDAEVLLAAALGVERTYLHAHGEQELTVAETADYEASLKRREHNEPVAYIIGTREFYGRPFAVDARALIPRPETEGVVERAVAFATEHFKTHLKDSNLPCPVRIAELGTGCGNIAVSVALELAAAGVPSTVVAADISPESLELAKENWKRLSDGVPTGNIKLSFVESDLFAHSLLSDRPFELILANLPYVEDTWRVDPRAQQDVVFYEPDLALFGGPDGLDIYRRFFADAPTHLSEGGRILIEYGETQTAAILPLIEASLPGRTLTVHKDYAGLDRVLEID